MPELTVMINRILPDPGQTDGFLVEQAGFETLLLRYNKSLHSIRMHTGSERRLFFLESSALPFQKIALFTEYGVRAGSCVFDDARHTKGSLRWDEIKYRFRFENGQLLLSDAQHSDAFEWHLSTSVHPDIMAAILLMLCRRKSTYALLSPDALQTLNLSK